MDLLKARHAVPIAALGLLFATGCGTKTDVSGGTNDLGQEVKAEGSTLDCPKEVKGEEGTVFDCTLKNKSGKAQTVQLKIVKQDGDLAIQAADQQAYDTARQQVQGK